MTAYRYSLTGAVHPKAWCDPFAADIAGRLHRHADGTVHRHAPPYTDETHGAVVAFLDDGPTYPDGKPEPYYE